MSTPGNPAFTIAGPAYVFTRNKAFYSKGDIVVTPKVETFPIELAAYGAIQLREADATHEIKFTPVGRLDALSVLWPYGIISPGAFIHATAQIVSVDTATEIITFDSVARFRDGAPIVIGTLGTLPTGLSAGLYYLHKLSGTTGTLHTSEANALAATSPVNLTASGTGVSRIIEQEYLKIITLTGDQYMFHNTAITGSPDFIASAGSTPIGEVTFEAFRKFSTAPTSTSSFFTKSTGVTLDTSFDPAGVITQAYTLAWGASLPWSAMSTRAGIKASFPLSLMPVGDDASGTTTRRIVSADASFSCLPYGITEDDILTKLVVQDTGAGRGRSLSSTDNLVVSDGSAIYLQLYGAVLQPGSSLHYDIQTDRGGELTWKPTRLFASGVAKALYWVGATAAP
jgi:hypothetical protein